MEVSLELYGIAVIPIIVALVRIFRRAGIPSRWLPLVSLLIGLIIGVVYYAGEDYKKGIFVGLFLGLSATGLHSGVKNTLNGNVDKGNNINMRL